MKAYLAGVLPGYMIPAYLTVLAELPLSRSGKVDKARLPPPQAQPPAGAGHAAPATLLEAMIVSMYAELLGLEQVGATDSFFDLGGSSLLAMRLVSMLGEELDVDVGVAAVFQARTPRQLAVLLRDTRGLPDTQLGADGVEGLGRRLAGQPQDSPVTGA